MKVQELQVRGFGRLTGGHSFAFHPRITVIAAGNEAGKSTLLHAIRVAIFGMGDATELRQRFAPWSGPDFGLALTYSLDDGRRYRLTRSWEGGGEIGDLANLDGDGGGCDAGDAAALIGVDEAAFASTCWFGEDALRPGGAATHTFDAAVRQIADTAGRAASAHAQEVLRRALATLGSAGRGDSRLGHLAADISRLDTEMEQLRRRLGTLAAHQEQLRTLQQEAAAAGDRCREMERSWLAGSLALMAAQQQLLDEAQEQIAGLQEAVRQTAGFVDFPYQHVQLVQRLSADWQERLRLFREAEARGQGARDSLQRVMERRAQIASGLDVLGRKNSLEDDLRATVERLKPELSAAKGTLARETESETTDSRLEALRLELAGTGFASIPAGAVDLIAEPVEVLLAAKPRRWNRIPLWLLLLVSFSAAVMIAAQQKVPAAFIAAMSLTAVLALTLAGRTGTGDMAAARRQINRLCPGVSQEPENLERLREKLPALRALHDDIRRQELVYETHQAERDAATALATDLAQRLERLITANGLSDPSAGESGAGDWIALAEARLRVLEDAIEREDRRSALTGESVQLSDEEKKLRRFFDEEETRRHQLAASERALRELLERAGASDLTSLEDAVGRYNHGCAQRHRYEESCTALEQWQRRIALVGDQKLLNTRRQEFEMRLIERGGNPAEQPDATPLTPAALHELEIEVERAGHDARIAQQRAAELEARLHGTRDGLPALADLEDQRMLMSAEYDRLSNTRAALELALEKLGTVTEELCQDLGPRVAARISQLLPGVTAGRYNLAVVDGETLEIRLDTGERPQPVPLHLLSRGTRDQVSLLLRLSLAELLSSNGEALPLLLDDPFAAADGERRQGLVRCIAEVSREHQVIVATADYALAAELRTATNNDCAVVNLSPAAGELLLPGKRVALPAMRVTENR